MEEKKKKKQEEKKKKEAAQKKVSPLRFSFFISGRNSTGEHCSIPADIVYVGLLANLQPFPVWLDC